MPRADREDLVPQIENPQFFLDLRTFRKRSNSQICDLQTQLFFYKYKLQSFHLNLKKTFGIS